MRLVYYRGKTRPPAMNSPPTAAPCWCPSQQPERGMGWVLLGIAYGYQVPPPPLRIPSRTQRPSKQRAKVTVCGRLLAPCCSWSRTHRPHRLLHRKAGGLSGWCWGGRGGRFQNLGQCSGQRDKRYRRSPRQRLLGRRGGSRRPRHL